MTPLCSALDDHGAACDLSLEHEIDRALCADLERLADGLPVLPECAILRALSERLMSASERWVDWRWQQLFEGTPAWEARIVDSLLAEDLVEALWRMWRLRDTATTGQLSYMLRALFDGHRRAVALEEAQLGCPRCQSSAID